MSCAMKLGLMPMAFLYPTSKLASCPRRKFTQKSLALMVTWRLVSWSCWVAYQCIVLDENKEERTQQKHSSRKSKPSSLEPVIEEKKMRLEVNKQDDDEPEKDEVINRNGFNLVTDTSVASKRHKLKPNSFHEELISEYNEEVEKYRSSRLTLAVIESYQKPFSCEVCFVRFPSRAALIQHYSQSRVSNCLYVYVDLFEHHVFQITRPLSTPIMQQHTKPKLSCLKCAATFNKEDTFRDHALACNVPPPDSLYICDFCPRIFPPNSHPEQVPKPKTI